MVWEGWGRKTSPYPDQDVCVGDHALVDSRFDPSVLSGKRAPRSLFPFVSQAEAAEPTRTGTVLVVDTLEELLEVSSVDGLPAEIVENVVSRPGRGRIELE